MNCSDGRRVRRRLENKSILDVYKKCQSSANAAEECEEEERDVVQVFELVCQALGLSVELAPNAPEVTHLIGLVDSLVLHSCDLRASYQHHLDALEVALEVLREKRQLRHWVCTLACSRFNTCHAQHTGSCYSHRAWQSSVISSTTSYVGCTTADRGPYAGVVPNVCGGS